MEAGKVGKKGKTNKKFIIRPYLTELNLREDGRLAFQKTFDYMDEQQAALFILGGSVMSHLDESIIRRLGLHKGSKKDLPQRLRVSLHLAIARFRLVSVNYHLDAKAISRMSPTARLAHKQLAEAHRASLIKSPISVWRNRHGVPDEAVHAYLDGNYDPETYAWQDTAMLAKKLCGILKLSPEDFKEASEAMMRNVNFLGCSGSTGSGSSVSNLFGQNEKEDSRNQARIESKTAKVIGKLLESRKPIPMERAVSLVCKSLGHPDAEAAGEDHGGQTDKSTFRQFMRGEYGGSLKELAKKLQKDAHKHRNKSIIPHRETIGAFIKQCASGEFYNKATSESWKDFNAMMNGKYKHNIIFVTEKIALGNAMRKLESNEEAVKASKQLEKLIDKYEMDGNKRFVPKVASVNGLEAYRDVIQDNPQEDDESVKDWLKRLWITFSEGNDRRLRTPFRWLVESLARLETPESAIKDGCRLMSIRHKHESQRPHPFVRVQSRFTVGDSNIAGSINKPTELKPNRDGRSPEDYWGGNPVVWMSCRLLNGNRWQDMRIPIHNSRYINEVYYTRMGPDGNHALPLKEHARDVKHDYEAETKISRTAARRVNENRMLRRGKPSKRFERVKANSTHNVVFDPKTTASFNRRQDDIYGTINHRHPMVPLAPDGVFAVGANIIGIDLGESVPLAAGILQKCTSTDSEAVRYACGHWKVVGMGKPGQLLDRQTSAIRRKQPHTIIDPMSNMGEPFSSPICQKFIGKCRKFVRAKGSEEDNKAFDDMVKREPSLYSFHGRWGWLLKQMMKAAKGARLDPFREHLEWLLFRTKYGPTNRKSLNLNSMASTKNVISAIDSYMSRRGWKTVEQRQRRDGRLQAARSSLQSNLVNRRLERIKKEESQCIRLAHLFAVTTHLVLEDNLPKQNGASSRADNGRKADWRSRHLAQRLCGIKNDSGSCAIAGVRARRIDPVMTSHMDPFVYSLDNKWAMRARYTKVSLSSMTDYHANLIRSILLEKPGKRQTTEYYQRAVQDFARLHGLDVDEMRKVREACWYKKRIKAKTLYIPCRGGRVFLSTHRLQSDTPHTDSSGAVLWEQDADQVAALNVALRYIDQCYRSNKKGLAKVKKPK